MLLRNLSPSMGLANGTRLIVTHLSPRIIQANIVTGTRVGTSVLIPRIALTPTDSQLPFTFTRRQFPIRPAFAMTINKSQGQTFLGVFASPCVLTWPAVCGRLLCGGTRWPRGDGCTLTLPNAGTLAQSRAWQVHRQCGVQRFFTNLPMNTN